MQLRVAIACLLCAAGAEALAPASLAAARGRTAALPAARRAARHGGAAVRALADPPPVDGGVARDALASFGATLDGIGASGMSLLRSVSSAEAQATAQAVEAVRAVAPSLPTIALPPLSVSAPPALVEAADTLPPDVRDMLVQIAPVAAGVLTALAAGVGALAVLAEPRTDTPYPTGRYDAAAAAAYFGERPGALLFRALDLLRLGQRLGVGLLLDWRLGNLDKNERKRAKQLTQLLTDCGATFIKIGQALSIRADLLSPAYTEALCELQDRVPAFRTSIAYDTICAELGLPRTTAAGGIPSAFSELSPEPVAAASLGQVYRGRVRNSGVEVAVKVQRPGVLEAIAIDMYLIRTVASLAKRLFPGINSDLIGIVDEWGDRFIDELDYELEAQNALRFQRDIAKSPLGAVVTAPTPIPELSSKRVLTAEWVKGVRLDDRSNTNDDVGKLCAVGLTAYLTMLLETGTLHCDPHPGNLLRTEDGRLCILDWGLVTEIDPELQISFLEHVAHLTSRDYPPIPGDLVRLGFVPPDREEAIAKEGVAEILSGVYSQLAGGGGARKIDINDVARTLNGMTQTYGNMFRLPPYFCYVLRAFSVLEGIGLQNDPDYTIIDECLPYITQRLVSDRSPRSRDALRTFVSTASSSGLGRQLDPRRASQLLGGLSNYASATLGVNGTAEGAAEDPAAIAVRLMLDARGNPLQALALEEGARVADALTRDAAHQLGEALDAAGPLARALDPLGAGRVLRELLKKEREDDEVLATLGGMAALLGADDADAEQHDAGAKGAAAPAPGSAGALPTTTTTSLVQAATRLPARLDPQVREQLGRELWQQRDAAGTFAMRLGARLLLRASERLGRVSEPPTADGSRRGASASADPVVVAAATIGKAATALTAAQLAAASQMSLDDGDAGTARSRAANGRAPSSSSSSTRSGASLPSAQR